MAAPPPAFSLDSPCVRVQHYGAPLAIGKALARIAASVAVAVGLAGAAAIGPHKGGDVFVALAILAVLAAILAFLSALPLLAVLGATGLFALLAPRRAAGVSVGRELSVESAAGTVAFTPADVMSVDALDPGWITIRLDDGDVIRASIDDVAEVPRLAAALATAGTRGPWVSPLYPVDVPRGWARRAAIAFAAVAALTAFVVFPGPEGFACVVGGAGAILWLTVLRPGPVHRRLLIGSDGIALRSEVSSRFVSFARIDHVEPTDFGAVLALAGGERLPLAVLPPSSHVGLTGSAAQIELGWLRREALLARLLAGIEDSGAIAGAERLGRQGRSLHAWRDAVRDLVKEDSPGYRAALLPPEQAARIVEAGRADPEARIGAALALAGHKDPALDARLRIAVESCADEATRAALAEALDDRLDRWTMERVEQVRRA